MNRINYFLVLLLISIGNIGFTQPVNRIQSPGWSRSIPILAGIVEARITEAAEAMPAEKYSFAPTAGEFKGVRTFGEQVRHLSATNFILAAAALNEKPPADAGDETGPESLKSKAAILDYLGRSFAALNKAIATIDDQNDLAGSSPISPLKDENATRLGFVVEALVHSYDHYGQMVMLLRMNGIVPPASRSKK